MAISKTEFTGTRVSAQISDLITWLNTNATDIFDSIVEDTANEGVSFYKNDTEIAAIYYSTGYECINLYYKMTETATSSSMHQFKMKPLTAAIKTSSGIALLFKRDDGAPSFGRGVIFGKDSNGDITAVGFSEFFSDSMYRIAGCKQLSYGGTVLRGVQNISAAKEQVINPKAYNNVLIPIYVEANETPSDSVFIHTFTQTWYASGGDTGGNNYQRGDYQLTLNGVNYFSNGRVALKD
jgi:hypothetical protein